MNDARLARVAGAVALAVAGALLTTAGLLHAHVPGEHSQQMDVIVANAQWVPAHWALTLGQPLAIIAVLAVAARLRAPRGRNTLLAPAVVLMGLGLAIGTLGTLTAATAVPAAAASGDPALYGTAYTFAMGLGWTCVVLAAAGITLTGLHVTRTADAVHAPRALGIILAAGGGVFLAATTILTPAHPWTHPGLLKYGAATLGLLLLAAAPWRARESPGSAHRG